MNFKSPFQHKQFYNSSPSYCWLYWSTAHSGPRGQPQVPCCCSQTSTLFSHRNSWTLQESRYTHTISSQQNWGKKLGDKTSQRVSWNYSAEACTGSLSGGSAGDEKLPGRGSIYKASPLKAKLPIKVLGDTGVHLPVYPHFMQFQTPLQTRKTEVST